jgi:peptidylprolyl isomerase
VTRRRAAGGREERRQTTPISGIVAVGVLLVVMAGVVALLLRNDSGTSGAAPAAAATDMPVSGTLPTATTYEYAAAPEFNLDLGRRYTATILTPRGEIVIELLPEIAPETVNNFIFLAENNFYNGLSWHRVLEGFMAQGGDPLGTGTGGPGYRIPAEFTTQVSFDGPGLVAMARSQDPDSAGSQFFITTGAAPWLDGQYTIFGRVISGQDVVQGIPLRDPQNPADLQRPGETILGITISRS